jgi:hypothetical protein
MVFPKVMCSNLLLGDWQKPPILLLPNECVKARGKEGQIDFHINYITEAIGC